MSGNFSSRAPWKRSACDRCRAQKLRCHRDEDQSPDTCLRCLKSQVKCFTSKARPTGRPPSRQPTRVEQNDNNSLHTATSESGADMNMVDYDMSLDTFLDSIGMQHTDFGTSNELLDSASPPHSTPSIVPPPALGDPGPSQHPYQYSIPKMDPTTHGRVEDAGCLLSKLHYELSEQLYYIRSVPWDVKSALLLTFSHKSNTEETEISEPHPLVQVSKASTELENLLTGLRLPASTDHTSPTFSYSPSFSPRISTTQLLTALSCYIQIVSIYDIIFSKVLDYLTKNSRASTPFQAPAPKMYLGGLPIPLYQTLPGSLLVHLTEHQLQPIEQLMGLPEHYRVSSKSNESSNGGDMGLFRGQHSQPLLVAVIQLGEDGDGNHDGIRSIRSLKVKMRQIKDF
ncbi:hypothetical protein JX266_002322 [Neoarthrinium moseri]|nr:hypothetical protein JX266_002322 [Neoarthrinium moseri]